MIDSALSDSNPDTRKQAVAALSLIGPGDPYIVRLGSMLGDKDVEVRLAAISSLVDVRSKTTVPLLRKALQDPVPEVSFSAARALWTLQDPGGERALLEVLSGDTKTSSNFITKQVRDAMRMMHTPKTAFLFAVRQGIGFAPIPGAGEGVASMQALLSDPGVSGRGTAALLLGRNPDPQARAALRDALFDKDWSVRAAAVHSLALCNDVSLKRQIVMLLLDSKEAVRVRAAAGYLRLEMLQRRGASRPKPPAARK